MTTGGSTAPHACPAMPALLAHPLVRSIAPLWAFPLRWIGSLRSCNCGLSVALVPQAYQSRHLLLSTVSTLNGASPPGEVSK